MSFIIYMQQITIKELAKLIKSDNLQEYEDLKKEDSEEIEIWQPKQRFQDISEIPDDILKDIKLDPNIVYWGYTWAKPKIETFNS